MSQSNVVKNSISFAKGCLVMGYDGRDNSRQSRSHNFSGDLEGEIKETDWSVIIECDRL